MNGSWEGSRKRDRPLATLRNQKRVPVVFQRHHRDPANDFLIINDHHNNLRFVALAWRVSAVHGVPPFLLLFRLDVCNEDTSSSFV
jgi:hypothetical protein